MFCFNIIGPFYIQSILGLSPAKAGLLMMIFPISMAIAAPISGTLSDKIGSEVLTFIGLIVLMVIQIGFTTLHESSSIIFVGLLVALAGMGSGIFQPPNNSLLMSTVPKSELGVAGSINSLSRNMGMVVGISVATTTLFMMMSHKAGYRVTGLVSGHPEIFLYGMHAVFILSTVICMVAAGLTGLRLFTVKKQVDVQRRTS